MKKYWLGVASKDHVMAGVDGGFCQLCHGKKAPLTRMKKSDQLLYYAPKNSLMDGLPYQKIIAAGTLTDDLVYQFEMFPGFTPYRRNVTYEDNLKEVPLATLRALPAWSEVSSKLRFGHVEISQELYNVIHSSMVF